VGLFWQTRQPGATGALVKMEGVPSGMGGVIIYFSCQDCAVECARVPKNGGTIMKDKFSIGQYGYIALMTGVRSQRTVAG
jgi:predicted enzyme related to lactoylglutathione lyase